MSPMLDEMHRTIRDTARSFARAEVGPSARAMDESEALEASVLDRLAELGFLGLRVPESEGGAELDLLAHAIVVEELARADGSVALLGVVLGMAVELAPEPLLSGLVTGEVLPAVCLGPSEILSAEGDRVAGFARTVTPRAATHLLLPGAVAAGAPGLVASPVTTPLGFRAAGFMDVTLEGTRLEGTPPTLEAVARAADVGRLGLAALCLGLGEGTLEAAVAYAKDRKQFGVPIATFQAIQWMIADARTALDAARMLVLASASADGRGADRARHAAAEAATRTCHHALQIHGGYGYTREFPVERALRNATAAALFLGGKDGDRTRIAQGIL